MNSWDSIYEEKGAFQQEPSGRVEKAITFFKDKGLATVLDLGCGTGRHIRILLENGFDVYGCDSSVEALSIAEHESSQVKFSVCDMISLPYQDGLFEAVLCHHVIQHGSIEDIKKAVSEIYRILRKRGYLFLTTVSTKHPKALTGQEIEPNTRIKTDALDGNIPHHFFTEGEIRGLFADFEILELEHFEGPSELDPATWSAAWELYAAKR